MKSSATFAFGVLLLALAASTSACRTPSIFHLSQYRDNDACSTCKFAVRVLGDMLCDPSVDDTVVTWLDQMVCSQMSDKAQCRDLIRGLTPAAVEWLRMNADPDTMCGSINVCGTAGPHLAQHTMLKAKTSKQQLRANSRPNDMTCPMCMFVAGKVKEQISDPAFQDNIRAASLQACAQLPAGIMADACTDFVEAYELPYFKYLADMEPVEVCMMIGTCMDTALASLQTKRGGAPLLQLSPAHLAPIAQLKQAMEAAAAASAPHSNDHCETCKVVVNEMRQLVANPDIQAQVIDFAKQACSVFPSFQPTCEADVDQYAPMAFGMVLAYLQPEQVCEQLKMCPPPSLFNSVLNQALSLQASLLGGKLFPLTHSSSSFSIISSSSNLPTGIFGGFVSTSSSDGDDSSVVAVIEDEGDVEVDEEEVSSSSSSAHLHNKVVGSSGKAKVHGPGLALPMAS